MSALSKLINVVLVVGICFITYEIFFNSKKTPNIKVIVIERTTTIQGYEALCTIVFQGTKDTLRGLKITEPNFLKAKVPFNAYLWSNVTGDRIELCSHE